MNNIKTVSPGVIYCGHGNTRVIQTWPNGVKSGACNVCNQTHILDNRGN